MGKQINKRIFAFFLFMVFFIAHPYLLTQFSYPSNLGWIGVIISAIVFFVIYYMSGSWLAVLGYISVSLLVGFTLGYFSTGWIELAVNTVGFIYNGALVAVVIYLIFQKTRV